jgi:hypothetical protein
MQEDTTNRNSTVEKANKIVNALFEHLEKDDCECCKTILKGVFE